MNRVQMRKSVVERWRVRGKLQLECAKVLHEAVQVSVPVLIYGSEKLIWKKKEMSRIRVVQMDNLRGLLGIRRRNKVPNAQIRELCRVTKGVDERIDEGVLQWLLHMERVENDRIAKRVYVGESVDSPSIGRSRKWWIDTLKNCLKKVFDVRQERRMV